MVFASPSRDGILVKRVVGLPGERVEIDGRSLGVDGAPLAEPYAQPSGGYRGSFAVPDDAYLVLGDAREHPTMRAPGTTRTFGGATSGAWSVAACCGPAPVEVRLHPTVAAWRSYSLRAPSSSNWR